MDGSLRKETPVQFLDRLRGRRVAVHLKWGIIYRGMLGCVDRYMNVVLTDAAEVNAGSELRVGETYIRCNNVKLIEEVL
ncbi:U6 snRNA-associated Sm-like protein LSm6 [Pancytospora philotis]|nr:U6 snRNA-associated Sm-like protein LSm6 [Pancytospora philotis]